MTQGIQQQFSRRRFGVPPRFDPEQGKTVVLPAGEGYGYWVGGHGVVHDPEDERFYLYYRVREPLGKGRGGVCRIAESTDGVSFTDIWEASKDQLDAESIETATLIQDPATDRWRLYISYETRGTWRVDLLEADHPAQLDPWHHRTVMSPGHFGVGFIKDPSVYVVGGLYMAFVAVPAPTQFVTEADASVRSVGDDATALLTSPDGLHFNHLRYVLEPGQGGPGEWGHFRARINSVVCLPPLYVGFFDGGTSVYDGYEEWAGVAISHDLERWTRVSTREPWVRSPHGCVRYIDALVVGDDILYYYEYTRPDGSHELRVSREQL